MIKKLKQVMQPNPSVPYIRAGKEKEFAGIHKVLKTKSPAYTSNGQNDDEVYNASKVKVAPRPRGSKSPESSPKDSYGEGRIALKVSPDTSEDEYGGHDEETDVNEVYKSKLTLKQKMQAHGQKAREYEEDSTLNSVGDKVKAHFIRKGKQHRKAAGIAAKMAIKRRNEETEVDENHGATHLLRLARKTLRSDASSASKREAAESIKRSKERLRKNEPTVMTHEEAINELGNKILKSYIKKAKPEAEGYGRPVQGYGHKSFKRSQGVTKAIGIVKDRANPVRAKVHDVRHMSDGEIYDHTQTHTGIKDGDVLHMSKGRAGIMMKAWPTMHHGDSDALHSLKDGSSWDSAFRGRYKKSHEVAGNIKEDLDENHIHMTVTHESNTKPLFKAKAGSDAEVRTKLESLKANSKGYAFRVGVQNTKTGETWSGKPHHKFPGFGEETVRKEDLFIEQIPSIPPDQPIGLKPLAKASSIEGLARRGVKLRVAQKKHELLKKRII